MSRAESGGKVSELQRLIQAHPQKIIAFYNTAVFRREHGYPHPHELKTELDALKHQGYVVMQGEDLRASIDRTSHAHGAHNWMPDQVVIIPRALFAAVRTRTQKQFPKLNFMPLSFFTALPETHWLNSRPEGGGHRRRANRAFEREQNELAALHFDTDPSLF